MWGPLSFITAYMIATEHKLRYPLQLIVSLGQLYGDVLYYATSIFDLYIVGVSYSRPEAYYFWFYFVGMNAPWIIIPICLIRSSLKMTGRAFEALTRIEKSLKTGGDWKKEM
jgi:cholestenol delta-isomerase